MSFVINFPPSTDLTSIVLHSASYHDHQISAMCSGQPELFYSLFLWPKISGTLCEVPQ